MKEGQSAAGAPMLRDTVEAPAQSPASPEDSDGSDSIQPTSASVQSATSSSSNADEPVENLDTEEETASESLIAPELQASNDNFPAEALPSTGTEQ
jgi:hypothetical protein